MTQKYKHQFLEISKNWRELRNEFYDISPFDDVPENDKFDNIYSQEDLLLLQNNEYHIDLGWYGSENLNDIKTGYCLYLYKGEYWNDANFLEKYTSKNKDEITKKINEIIKLVDTGEYENIEGILIDEYELAKVDNYSSLIK